MNHNHYLQLSFEMANRIPEIKDYVHGLKLHFHENHIDITIRPVLKKAFGIKAVMKF